MQSVPSSVPWNRALLLLLVVVAAVYGFRLGQSSLWDIDEAIYADISRNMAESGDWVMPIFNGQPRYDKPPLLFWINAAAMHLLGVSEGTARLGNWVLAVVGVGLVGSLGARMFSPRAGFLAGLILASTLGWFGEGRVGLLDVGLSTFIVWAFYHFWRLWEGDRLGYLGMGLALALAILTKGPVALILVGAAVFLFLGWRRFWAHLLSWWAVGGLAVFAAVAAPWHVAIYRRAGLAWVSDYFGYHMFTRFTRPIEAHGYDWYFYLLVLAAGFLPWSGTVAAVLWEAGHRWLQQRRRVPDSVRLLMWWFVVVMVFFSLSRTKLPGYILPAFPALALLLAGYCDRALGRPAFQRFLEGGLWGSFALGLLGLVGVAVLRVQVPPEYHQAYWLAYLPAGSLAVGSAATWLAYRARRNGSTLLVGLGTAAMMAFLFLGGWLLPEVDALKPVKPLAMQARTHVGPGVRLVSAMGDASTTFYARAPVVYVLHQDEVRRLLEEPGVRTLALVPSGMLAELQQSLPDLRVLAQASFGRLVERGQGMPARASLQPASVVRTGNS